MKELFIKQGLQNDAADEIVTKTISTLTEAGLTEDAAKNVSEKVAGIMFPPVETAMAGRITKGVMNDNMKIIQEITGVKPESDRQDYREYATSALTASSEPHLQKISQLEAEVEKAKKGQVGGNEDVDKLKVESDKQKQLIIDLQGQLQNKEQAYKTDLMMRDVSSHLPDFKENLGMHLSDIKTPIQEKILALGDNLDFSGNEPIVKLGIEDGYKPVTLKEWVKSDSSISGYFDFEEKKQDRQQGAAQPHAQFGSTANITDAAIDAQRQKVAKLKTTDRAACQVERGVLAQMLEQKAEQEK